MERHKCQYEVLNAHNPNGETGQHWENRSACDP